MAAMRTICIVGFPAEAQPRELKNLCRFMTGFEGAHVAFAGPGQSSALFVKFVSPEIARNAMDMLHGAPFDVDAPQVILKVEYARREMEVRPNSLLPAPMVALTPPPAGDRNMALARPPAAIAPPGGVHMTDQAPPNVDAYPPVHRPVAPLAAPPPQVPGPNGQMIRVGLTGGELTTIVVLRLKEKGFIPEELMQWFQQRPGFLTLHVNERIDGLFVKFGSGTAAERAMEDANAQNFGCEWARRNLDDDIGPNRAVAPPSAFPQPVAALPPAAPSGYIAAKRQRSNLGELNTITILGIRDKELAPEMLQQWFSQKPGFVAMQINERINGVFAKFSDQASAMAVLEEANAMQWGAEWPRRNLDI